MTTQLAGNFGGAPFKYLGDWTDRDGNSNIEAGLLSAYLARRGHTPAQIGKAFDMCSTAQRSWNGLGGTARAQRLDRDGERRQQHREQQVLVTALHRVGHRRPPGPHLRPRQSRQRALWL